MTAADYRDHIARIGAELKALTFEAEHGGALQNVGCFAHLLIAEALHPLRVLHADLTKKLKAGAS